MQIGRPRIPTASIPPWLEGTSRAAEIGETGLVIGAGTLLARMTKDKRLALYADHGRLLALLSVACGRPVPADVLIHIEAAADYWRRGDKALAHLRLIFAGLPRLDDPVDAYRLRLAEYLLDEGMPPEVLMKELGLDPSALVKYDPDQPRVPAGSGRESGRWAPVTGTFALEGPFGVVPSFLADASPSIVADLAAFLARFSVPTAILGALVIPTPNSGGVTAGSLPGVPDIHFEKDGPAGTLRLTTKAGDGSDVMIVAENRRGLYVDVRTGQPLGRDLGEQIYLDNDAVDDAIPDELANGGRTNPARDRRRRTTSRSFVPRLSRTPRMVRKSILWIMRTTSTRASIHWRRSLAGSPS